MNKAKEMYLTIMQSDLKMRTASSSWRKPFLTKTQ